MLFLDGVFIGGVDRRPTGFRRVKAPTGAELTQLAHTIAYRVARHLERQGWMVRDAESSYLTADGLDIDPDSPMNHLLGSSVTYRISVGPQQGRKVFTLQTLPDLGTDKPFGSAVSEASGFSLHAGVAVRARERKLKAWVAGLALRAVRYRGVIPDSWNKVSTCNRCGPVWSDHGLDMLSCGWCEMRESGKWFPHP